MSSDLAPNPLRASWSMLGARRVRRPAMRATGRFDHSGFRPVLEGLAAGGIRSLPEVRAPLATYLAELQSADPDLLGRTEALAFWINLYNAAALGLAAETAARGADSVLRVRGAFSAARLAVMGEGLSLDDVEHGKVRRFGDPRIHAALVCGSLSCPTLRSEPFTGPNLDDQLDDQMRRSLASGGAMVDRSDGTLRLSRIFLWFGADYVRPHRMPTLLPARRSTVARSLAPWMDPVDAAWIRTDQPRVEFLDYDWSLACTVG